MSSIPVPTITINVPPEDERDAPNIPSDDCLHLGSTQDMSAPFSTSYSTDDSSVVVTPFLIQQGYDMGMGLRTGASGDFFLSPLSPEQSYVDNLSGRSSPSELWSPLSSASGDVFPETGSEYSLTPSTPSRSHSPNFDFANISLSEDGSYPEMATFEYLVSRHRSSSLNARPDVSLESFDTRPRSSSVSALPRAFETHYPAINTDPQLLPTDYESSSPSPANGHARSASWGGPERSPSSLPGHQTSTLNFLTVPSLQRRNARKRNSTERSSRGRSRELVPVGIFPHSASSSSGTYETMSQGSLVPSDMSSEYGFTFDDSPTFDDSQSYTSFDQSSMHVDTDYDSLRYISADGYSSESPHSLISPFAPSPTSPSHSPTPSFASSSSPGFSQDLSDFSFNISVIPPEDVNINRRNTFTTGSPSPDVDQVDLQRALSDPTPRRRIGRSSHRIEGGSSGMFVFRSGVQPPNTESNSGMLEISDIRGPSPSSSRSTSIEPHFKETVASEKIYKAAKSRRRPGNNATFKCEICGQDFTSRHNLKYHVDSHSGTKKYACDYCGQRSVHPHVIKRHMEKSCKSRPKEPPSDQPPPPPPAAAT